MKRHWILMAVAAAAVSVGSVAQDAPGMPPAPGQGSGQDSGQGSGRGAGRGWGAGMGMGAGKGMMGTVAAIAPDHLTVKTATGETWTVHYSANTRFMKQAARPASSQAPAAGGQAGGPDGKGMRMRANPPEFIAASDVKVGDVVMAGGEMDRDAHSIGAIGVLVLDPGVARRMQQMQANYGKTWLVGRIGSIDGMDITLEGGPDNHTHAFTVDDNTEFRRRREPITLADLKAGDRVRVEGAVKEGHFVASRVIEMPMPPARGGPVQRQGPPPR